MGKFEPEPRVRSCARALFVLAAATLAGCAHRDVVDTPVGWWHQLEGGEIAKQRPPPPGIDAPYPAVGTTPAHPPPVASPALRQSVTGALLRQRNLTDRLNADDPIPPSALPPPPPPAASAPASAPGTAPTTVQASSATLAAAQAPPATIAAAPAVQDSAPELALPAVQVQPSDAVAPVTIPAIPGAPPAPPRLPGLAIAAGAPARQAMPDYQLAAPSGTQVAFAPGTDSLLGGQLGALHAIAARRGAGGLLVRGYGDARAADTEAQVQALTLASLRARAVARALQGEGVPASSILLRAEAFGRGASVSLYQ